MFVVGCHTQIAGLESLVTEWDSLDACKSMRWLPVTRSDCSGTSERRVTAIRCVPCFRILNESSDVVCFLVGLHVLSEDPGWPHIPKRSFQFAEGI
jgi:hypothetical protein